jgi:hypothetical protein
MKYENIIEYIQLKIKESFERIESNPKLYMSVEKESILRFLEDMKKEKCDYNIVKIWKDTFYGKNITDGVS